MWYFRLTQCGAQIEVRNSKDWTALDYACANGFPKAAQCLLEAGALVQPKGKIKVECLFHLIDRISKINETILMQLKQLVHKPLR